MMRPLLSFIVLCGVGVLCPAVSMPGTVAVSPAMESQGTGHLADSVMLQQVVVTGTRTPKLLADAPVATRVISSDDIRKADVANIADLLQQEMPGIEFSWAMSKEVSLNMSGFGGTGVLFLIDGERLAGETMNNPDFQRLSLENVERIEIVRGAASSLYGSNAVAGVINIITKKAARPFSLSLNTHAGSHDEYRAGAVIGFRKNEYRISNIENIDESRYYRENRDYRNSREDRTLFSSTLDIQYTHQGRYSMSPFDGGVQSALVSNRNHTWNINERFCVRPLRGLNLTARAGYFFRERDYDPTQSNRYRDFSAGLKADYQISDNQSIELAYAFDQYDKSDLSLITGSDIRDYSNVQNSLRALYNIKVADGLALIAGADYMRDYLTSYMFSDGNRKQYTADGFAQLDWEATQRLELVGGVRYDYYSESSSSGVTTKLSARYKLDNGLTLRASYGGGFRAPTLKEMYMDFDMAGIFKIYGNRDLKPERSHNAQVSAEYRKRGWNLTVSGWHNFVSHRITTIWDASATGLYASKGAMRYQNIGNMNIVGAEANVQKAFRNGLNARLAYCFSKAIVKSSELYSDNTRPHSVTANVGYEISKISLFPRISTISTLSRTSKMSKSPETSSKKAESLSLNLALRWFSSMSIHELDDTFSQLKEQKTFYHPYTIVKLTAAYRMPNGLTLNATADNILNYRPALYTYYSPKTTGTTFSVGLSLDI